MIRVDAPPAEAGLKVLLNKQEGRDPIIHVYSPDTGRARRMVGSGASNSILGTDFTYADALHFESFLKTENTRRGKDQNIDGKAVFVLETFPPEILAIPNPLFVPAPIIPATAVP